MLPVLLIIAAVWVMALVMVVSLCVFAKRGDEALTAASVLSACRPQAAPRTRGVRDCGRGISAAQR